MLNTTIRIHQIKPEKEMRDIGYMNYDLAIKYGVIERGDYGVVFEGKVRADNLEDIYEIFNFDDTENYEGEYKGHSLSISDVIEVISGQKVKSGFYFVDNIGFKELKNF